MSNIFFNNENIINYFFVKKKKIIISVTVLTLLASIFFSGPTFITPLYKSSAILYPSNLYKFSDENETEQMLQFLRSDEIINRLIKDFNLYKVYNINPNRQHALTDVKRKLKSNLSISKSQYEGVDIKVYDASPQRAKTMLDSVISYYNQLVKQQYDVKYKEIMQASSLQMNRLWKQIDSLQNNTRKIRLQKKVINADKQSRELVPLLLKDSSSVLYRNFLESKEKLAIMDSVLFGLNNLYINEKTKYENAFREYRKNIKYYIMVSPPQVPDKKAYPIRWLIVLFSLLGAYTITFITFAIIENKK